MEDHSSSMRGIINDLLRSLSAALLHTDDLIMKIERDSVGFSDAILTNQQLSRSIELFLELRWECHYFCEHLFNNNLSNKSESLLINQDLLKRNLV